MAQQPRASTPPLGGPGEEVQPFLESGDDAHDGEPRLPIDILIDQYRTGRSPHRHKHACEERWAQLPLNHENECARCARDCSEPKRWSRANNTVPTFFKTGKEIALERAYADLQSLTQVE